MAGFYYLHTNYPIYSSKSSSVLDKAEWAKVQAGFDKIQDPTGYANYIIKCSNDQTKLIASSVIVTDSGVVSGITGLTSTGTVNLSGATVIVPTATPGDNSTNAASTAFAQALAFVAALPAQIGNSGKFVTTNGSSASWAVVSATSISPGTAMPGQELQVSRTSSAIVGHYPIPPDYDVAALPILNYLGY